MTGKTGRTPHGGRIDRSRPIPFTFDGKSLSGFAGDTLASALLANGVKLIGRSRKLRRPRGIMTAGAEEPSTLVALRSRARLLTNTSVTMTELTDGLEALSLNAWPSRHYDLLAGAGLLAPVVTPACRCRKYQPLERRRANDRIAWVAGPALDCCALCRAVASTADRSHPATKRRRHSAWPRVYGIAVVRTKGSGSSRTGFGCRFAPVAISVRQRRAHLHSRRQRHASSRSRPRRQRDVRSLSASRFCAGLV